jgi:hypothetical protein
MRPVPIVAYLRGRAKIRNTGITAKVEIRAQFGDIREEMQIDDLARIKFPNMSYPELLKISGISKPLSIVVRVPDRIQQTGVDVHDPV